MVDNPFEAQRGNPHEAGPAIRVRRGEGYNLPPIGPARRFDLQHHRRQDWIGVVLIVLMVLAPLGYFFFVRRY